MRSQSAVFVDAGYLIASSATRVTGSSLRRGVNVDYEQLVAQLIQLVERSSGLPLLRVYWYDAARNGVADHDQEQVASLPRVKLRLGRVGVEGEQKGVDLRIGLDMVGHSRNGSVDTIYLLSGDDDLTEAVEEVQAQGVRVVVLAVPNASGAPHGVSRHLMREADDIEVLDVAELDASISSAVTAPRNYAVGIEQVATVSRANPGDVARRVPAVAQPSPVPGPTAVYSSTTGGRTVLAPEFDQNDEDLASAIDEVVRNAFEAWARSASPEQLRELNSGRPSIPRDLDRALLVDLSDALARYDLTEQERFQLRGAFWRVVAADE